MSLAATIVAVLAVAGAFASWAAGAVFYLRTLRSIPAGDSRSSLLAIVAWPFVTGRLKGAAAENTARVNKALVALFVCLMIATAATSLATNLSRWSR
jgi:hypothetical protein